MMETIFWGISGVAVFLHVWFKYRTSKALWTIAFHLRAIHRLSDIHDLAWNINRAVGQDTELSVDACRHIRAWSAGIMNHVDRPTWRKE